MTTLGPLVLASIVPVAQSAFSPSVAWSPNGELLAATGLEGDAVVFEMSTARWREIACSIAGRTLTREEWNQYLPGRSYRPDCG